MDQASDNRERHAYETGAADTRAQIITALEAEGIDGNILVRRAIEIVRTESKADD